MPYEGRARDLRGRIYRAIGYPFPMDIVVRRPEDMERRYHEHDPLIRQAIDKGQLVYERQRAGVGHEGGSAIVAIDSPMLSLPSV
jgi:hypothetical protein